MQVPLRGSGSLGWSSGEKPGLVIQLWKEMSPQHPQIRSRAGWEEMAENQIWRKWGLGGGESDRRGITRV